MARVVGQRCASTILTLLLVSIIVFFSAQVLPGDVGRTILGQFATTEQVEQLNHELGVDQPLPVRYGNWLTDFVSGDWGTSYLLRIPIRDLVLERFVNSLYLGMFALAITVPVSIFFGVMAGLRRNGALDRTVSVVGLSLTAVPEFVTGVTLLVLFAVQLPWLPVTSTVPTADPRDWFRQLLLPALPLVLLLFGYISRMARAGTIDVVQSNYVRTATLKGLPRRRVVTGHVLRNALVPTVTVIAVQTGYLVGGLVVIETLFNYPGMGKLLYDSAVGHDIAVLEACVLLIAVVLLVANLIADFLAAALNPRIRLRASE